jgi:NADP-dependent 3-hydroxy acid dehydrogenase YdfG
MLVARDAEELSRAAHELRKMGAAVHTKTADITDEMTPTEVVAETIANFGRVDVLVNNAGIISVAPLANVSEAPFHECRTAILEEHPRTHCEHLLRWRPGGRASSGGLLGE